MANQVKEIVKYCPICQRMNKKLNTERPELHPIPVKSPMYHIGIDFVGPISPTSSAGNRYILTVSDYFTRYGWAKALPTKEAKNVVSALKELFFIMGIPHVITSDQGSEFNNSMNAELMRSMGIDHRLTTDYHPQANGLDEHFNQMMKSAITKYSRESRDEWDVKLGEIVYAYNTSFQESTKHSPFEAMFGRVARLPVDCNMDYIDANQRVEIYSELRSPDDEERAAKRQKIEEAVKENIEKTQQKQKAYYDRKHGAGASYQVGALVNMKDFNRKKRKGGCLDFRWKGPYIITASLGKGLYRLREQNGEKVVERVNGFHLERWHEKSTSGPVTEDDQHADTEDDDIPPLPPPMPTLEIVEAYTCSLC